MEIKSFFLVAVARRTKVCLKLFCNTFVLNCFFNMAVSRLLVRSIEDSTVKLNLKSKESHFQHGNQISFQVN